MDTHETDSYGEGLDLSSDEEMLDLAVDEGEDGYTNFDAAMLVNVRGSVGI